MLISRTNLEWIQALTSTGSHQAEAIEDLRELLLRATLYTLSQSSDYLQTLDSKERVALAEDCAQDALLAVLDHLGDFRGESKFTTWVYKFGVNVALTRARQERWKRVSLEELNENIDALDWLQWREDAPPSIPELPALKAEVITLIKKIFREELTERQREVIKLIAFDQVPMDVIVERLGTNRNAIYKLLHDARIKVRRQLIEQGYDLEEVFGLFSQRS